MSEWWEQPLEALNTEQWEALCDGCARCCLHKLEDEDTGDIFFAGYAAATWTKAVAAVPAIANAPGWCRNVSN